MRDISHTPSSQKTIEPPSSKLSQFNVHNVLKLLLLGFFLSLHRHLPLAFLLSHLALEHPPCYYRRRNKPHHRPTRDTPYLDTDAPPRRPREGERPLHIARQPPTRYPEHRPLGEPPLEEEAQTVGAEPAEDGGCSVKG